MDAHKKNENQKKLVNLQADFLKIGVSKMPFLEVKEKMPKDTEDPVKWCTHSKDVWHFRRNDFDTYLPIFQEVYNDLVNIEVKEGSLFKTA